MVFEDPDFPAGPRSIGQNRHQDTHWRRVPELRGVCNPPELFGKIEAESVGQGELGDCWLIAAFAAVADFPGHIKSLFEPRAYSPDGRYAVRLYDPQEGWQTVVIDDRIPCLSHSGGNRPCFCQVQGSGHFWALLLEKAVAKFCGSYGHLAGGGSAWAFQALTGVADQLCYMREEPGEDTWIQMKFKTAKDWRATGMKRMGLTARRPIPSFSAPRLFKLVAYCNQSNCLLIASINGSSGEAEHRREDGLIEDHAYSILDAQMAHGRCLVKLRNPWGGTEWNGAFSDSSKEWRQHPELQKDLDHESADDGEFWMPWEDFSSTFNNVKLCPGSLLTPKMSCMAAKKKEGIRCAHCKNVMSCVWCMTDFGGKEGPGEWTRLEEGDLCFMCRRSHVGLREFRAPLRRVPGVDLFEPLPQFEFCAAVPPREKPVCKFGPDCYRYNPDHFAEYEHPWLAMNFTATAYARTHAGGSSPGEKKKPPPAAAAPLGVPAAKSLAGSPRTSPHSHHAVVA